MKLEPGVAVETLEQDSTVSSEPPVLHIVRKGDYPRALCGHIVRDEFNPHRTDTAGRDRCTECMVIVGRLRRGGGES